MGRLTAIDGGVAAALGRAKRDGVGRCGAEGRKQSASSVLAVLVRIWTAPVPAAGHVLSTSHLRGSVLPPSRGAGGETGNPVESTRRFLGAKRDSIVATASHGGAKQAHMLERDWQTLPPPWTRPEGVWA